MSTVIGDTGWHPDATVYDTFVVAVSTETIISLEGEWGNRFSGSVWSGMTSMISMYPSVSPAIGLETALETRFYPLSQNHNRMFLALYGGACKMLHDGDSFAGLTGGVKLGYKSVLGDFDNTQILLEPYVSMSISPLNDYYNGYSEKAWTSWLMTLGLRWVLRFYEIGHSRRNRIEVEETKIKAE